MSDRKPGEYELPITLPKHLIASVVQVVEQAHAERNCGNCEFSTFNFPYTTCERHKFRPPYHTIKCNDWQAKP